MCRRHLHGEASLPPSSHMPWVPDQAAGFFGSQFPQISNQDQEHLLGRHSVKNC